MRKWLASQAKYAKFWTALAGALVQVVNVIPGTPPYLPAIIAAQASLFVWLVSNTKA